jgi:hypothetical protein
LVEAAGGSYHPIIVYQGSAAEKFAESTVAYADVVRSVGYVFDLSSSSNLSASYCS